MSDFITISQLVERNYKKGLSSMVEAIISIIESTIDEGFHIGFACCIEMLEEYCDKIGEEEEEGGAITEAIEHVYGEDIPDKTLNKINGYNDIVELKKYLEILVKDNLFMVNTNDMDEDFLEMLEEEYDIGGEIIGHRG